MAVATREEQALAEIAATAVRPVAASILFSSLLLLLAVGPSFELARWRADGATVFSGSPQMPSFRELARTWQKGGALDANEELRAALLALEDRMGRESALSTTLRPRAQLLLLRQLRYGNSQVIAGAPPQLYFRTAFDHLVGAPFLSPAALDRRRRAIAPEIPFDPDPVPGLTRLGEELGRRGIRLVFFPVPVKASIHPEPLLGRSRAASEPLQNRSFAELLGRLRASGIPSYDPAPEMRARAVAGEALYFSTDTHWNARGMEIAARGLARFLRTERLLPELPPAGLEKHSLVHDFRGDLAQLLGLGALENRIPRESADLVEISGLGHAPIATLAGGADVLLLGDSYAAVFAFDTDGRAAGFGERLAFELDRPVRRVARVAANDLPGRIRWLREEPALLDGIRVVVYEVTARAFSSTDWSAASLEKSPAENFKRRKQP